MKLYHATTPKKVRNYHHTGRILKPVRGFMTPQGAMAWAMKVGRTVILEIEADRAVAHKLPDHHNAFGEAWWFDQDIEKWSCYYSAGGEP